MSSRNINPRPCTAVQPERSSSKPSKPVLRRNTCNPSRRNVLLTSVTLPQLTLGMGEASRPEAFDADPRTIVNSILGAYGLPKIGNAQGFKQFDDLDEDYTFEYPAAWVRRKNTLRSGMYISDFNTADKLSVETLPMELEFGDPLNNESFKMAVVNKLLNPGLEIGGDSRIEVPRPSAVKLVNIAIKDGIQYFYYAFPSSTTTRSGYDVRRKNLAVAGIKKSRNLAFVLGVSARSDEYNEEKRKLMESIVESFRIR